MKRGFKMTHVRLSLEPASLARLQTCSAAPAKSSGFLARHLATSAATSRLPKPETVSPSTRPSEMNEDEEFVAPAPRAEDVGDS